MRLRLAISVIFVVQGLFARAADPPFSRSEVIYGRKFGTALTLDVIQPKATNGFGVIGIISGGFFSNHDFINPAFFKPLLDRGYTIFAVVHGSQPRYIIPEIVEDLHRSVRWIRHHASEYGVSPDKLGVIGGSAGGHLSLTLGTQGKSGPADAKDPVDRESSAVQAVACFFPPVDFLNWREPVDDAVGIGVLKDFQPAFGSRSGSAESHNEYGKEISPFYFVTATVPPTLIIHGEADKAGADLPGGIVSRKMPGDRGQGAGETRSAARQRPRLARHGERRGIVRRLVRRVFARRQTLAVEKETPDLDTVKLHGSCLLFCL